MINVFIADDHQMLREGLRRILEETGDMRVVGEAASGTDVLRAAREQNWDVLLLDLSLPEMNGLDVLKQLKLMNPKSVVLVLSMYDEDQYATRALKAGASGYLMKGQDADVLTHAIRRVHSGRKYVTESLAEHLADRLDTNSGKDLHKELSDREFQVFTRLAEGKRQTDIAKDLKLSVKTIATHRRRILDKLRLNTSADLVRYAMQRKLIEKPM